MYLPLVTYVFFSGDEDYPNGHPQLAQVAIQQGELLAKNLIRLEKGKEMKPFHYRNLGSMATVGRNRAVAEFSKVKMQGWFAWVMWLVVHLRSILGVRNKVVVLLNWVWNYFTYDQSMRMIVYARKAKEIRDREAIEATTHWGKDLMQGAATGQTRTATKLKRNSIAPPFRWCHYPVGIVTLLQGDSDTITTV